ncbi:MAG: galactokinase [Planctomycetota bacterium]|nr:galactokinase [Planctomycetota bacterium]
MDLRTERSRLLSAFQKRFGSGGQVRAAIAPGRSNLIGEHTDYNGGLVLPIAVDRHILVLFRPARGTPARIAVYTETLEARDEFSVSGTHAAGDPKLHWANYVRGTAQALINRGIKLKGGDLYITGDLPRGAGLSSSAALETATALALLTLAGRAMAPQPLAFACQEAEHRFAGVRCGIMDQTVVGLAKPNHALLLDCHSMATRHVPIALRGYSFAVFDTGVRHKLAGSEYNKRRAECEHAAALLKQKTLRGVTLDAMLAIAGSLTASEHRRVRHVLTENLRVVQFAAALARGDVAELGALLDASHESLSRDYAVSCVELDQLVAQLRARGARDHGCAGARMTGGGFGGAVVALLKTSAFPPYARAMKPYAKGGSLLLTPSAGARVVRL